MNYGMHYGASNFVEKIDQTFYFILGIDIFFLILITALMIIFVTRYHRKRHQKAVQVQERTWLEVLWITIPLILVLAMFYIGWKNYIPLRRPPKDALEIKVIGRMWDWQFVYPDGKVATTLYVPINKAVKLNLYSPDVLHGFFVPAFRIKEDVVPGKNNFAWFKATELGEYDIFCSAYCGMRHAYMYSKVKVLPTEEFNNIMASLGSASSTADGDAILRNNGCYSCHSTDGTRLVGPSFKGLWGAKKTVITADGKKQTIVVDEKYIEESILDPNAKVEEGYMPNVMRSYKGVIKDEDIKAIVEYFKKAGEQK